MVVDLAVERDLHRAVLVAHRRASGNAQVDDGQPTLAQDHATVFGLPKALVVGAAVPHSVAHGGDAGRIDPSAASRDHADYPAHRVVMP
jgi:hypothetical protein